MSERDKSRNTRVKSKIKRNTRVSIFSLHLGISDKGNYFLKKN